MSDSYVYFWSVSQEKAGNNNSASSHHNLQNILERAKGKPNCYFKGIPDLKKMGADVEYEYDN